jgi:sterol desaturase/sphingolipid hydroxylase (fatty acid hydroxylase superfamily)
MFSKVVISFILGVISWTLAEYLLHRFMGHELNGFFKKFIFRKEHLKHHYKKHYFARTIDKVLTCIGIGPVVFILAYAFISIELSLVFTTSFLGMYFVYELIHRRIHTHEPKHFYARFMRAHHFYHHHIDPSMNHGVTVAFWDRVFGTFVKANLDDVYSLEKSGESYEDSIMECKRNQGLC